MIQLYRDASSFPPTILFTSHRSSGNLIGKTVHHIKHLLIDLVLFYRGDVSLQVAAHLTLLSWRMDANSFQAKEIMPIFSQVLH